MLAFAAFALVLVSSADPVALFNGKNLDGWREASRDKASLAGKTDAFGGRFKVIDGVLVIDPAVKGDLYIETEKTFPGDLRIIIEFKPGPKCNNDVFIRGTKFDLVPGGKEGMNLKVGESATCEIVIKGDVIEHRLNSESVRRTKAKPAPTSLRIRAEFGSMEIKSIQLLP
jgi:hypothetical protein